MPTVTETRAYTVALIGNPNTGKSTLFNALAGVRQRVGNYPGVTVEKKLGQMTCEGRRYTLVDLPGTYSLAPRSPDEMVAVDVLLGRRDDEPMPDAVVCIVDASNLQRNLYLVSQILELELPTLVALNMTDVAEDRGVKIDLDRLRQQLGAPVVAIQANRRRGLDELKAALASVIEQKQSPPISPFPPVFQDEVAHLRTALSERPSFQGAGEAPRFLAERLLLDTGGYLEEKFAARDNGLNETLQESRERLRQAGAGVPAIEAISRYAWVERTLEGVVSQPAESRVTAGDRLDRVLTHRLWGTAIFALLMAMVFCSIFFVADTPMGWIDTGVGWFGEWVGGLMAEGPLRSLIVDGVIAGVGAVVIFLPQILMLFFFIAILEDCGYMARAAYLMDKLMSRVGLSGKSFIPLLSSFACAIPGIMAARVIENRRDRLTTILVAPLMSCSARLPVYIILTAAFIPADTMLGAALPGLTLFSMYLLGIVVAVAVAWVLKKTLLKGDTPPFVMELPSYKTPSASMVLYRMFERGWAFLRRAGTLIFAMTIVVWALAYYPRHTVEVEGPYGAELANIDRQLAELPKTDLTRPEQSRRQALEDRQVEIGHEIAADHLRQSFLGRMGQTVEPVVRPLGWDWRIGCAAIASFPAREVVMGALGVIYHLGSDLDVGEEEDQGRLEDKLKAALGRYRRESVQCPSGAGVDGVLRAAAQCVSTLAIMKRETNSWRWPLFTFVYMTALAYAGAFITYQVGMLFV